MSKESPRGLTGKFQIEPWSFEVTGLVNKPKKYDLDDIKKRMPFEERLYRFRCVERWAMAVPWTGFPISELIKEVEPKAEHDEVIREAYLRTVNRLPDERELERARAHMKLPGNLRDNLSDLLWVLLNTQEFITNH